MFGSIAFGTLHSAAATQHKTFMYWDRYTRHNADSTLCWHHSLVYLPEEALFATVGWHRRVLLTIPPTICPVQTSIPNREPPSLVSCVLSSYENIKRFLVPISLFLFFCFLNTKLTYSTQFFTLLFPLAIYLWDLTKSTQRSALWLVFHCVVFLHVCVCA